MKKKPITLRDTVEKLLRAKVGDCMCDACIARELGEQDIDDVKRVMSFIGSGHRIEFSRYHARCAMCGDQNLIIRAKPNFGLS